MLSEPRIIVAEDQLINIKVLKSQQQEFEKIDICDFCYNGEEAFMKAVELVKKAISELNA